MKINKLQIEKIIEQLNALQQEALLLEQKFLPQIQEVHPAYRESTRNLLHYLALRHHDIRDLQQQLADLGLSSLGRSESHVLANLQAVTRQLQLWLQRGAAAQEPPAVFFQRTSPLKDHTDQLLGPASAQRDSRIMVTFSTDLATDYNLVCQMIAAGMNCARINCAHDDEKVWAAMIANIKRAEKALGKSCKVLMDLMGPKLRTGPLKPGPDVVALHPSRDELGKLIAPLKLWLSFSGSKPPVPVDASLPLEETSWLEQVQPDDLLCFRDTRNRKRKLRVIARHEEGLLVHLKKTAYIGSGTRLQLLSATAKNQQTQVPEAIIGKLPAREVPLVLKDGDVLVLHRDPIPGEPSQYDDQGVLIRPAHISCTLAEIFTQVKVGEPILFDDGEIEGVITEVKPESLLIRITGGEAEGRKLRSDKGINLPESNLQLNRLTGKDKQDMAFVVRHADIVNLSFVNHPDMVTELQAELQKHQAKHVAIMLKIETKAGFSNLPHLLLAVMRTYPAGIMIARGDLAVECGWQRLAEVQEEILWLCEAAHLPVVWATQVLEKLAKKGRPSRAEITDAAMAQRADCVMLNKGPYVLKAISMLDDILKRMQAHQYKKNPMLRSLHVSEIK